jgi:hypothetical protein
MGGYLMIIILLALAGFILWILYCALQMLIVAAVLLCGSLTELESGSPLRESTLVDWSLAALVGLKTGLYRLR